MANSLLPARRLLRLRERAEAAAKHELQQAQAALAQEQTVLSSYRPLQAGTTQSAQSLTANENAREAARERVVMLTKLCAHHQLIWAGCKRERRQAELLLEKRLEVRQALQDRREVSEQEDWGRVQRAGLLQEEEP